MSNLPAIEAFPVQGSAVSQRWSSWKQRLEYYLAAANITDTKQRRALLLHLSGIEVQELFQTLDNTGEDYDAAIKVLDEQFLVKKNIAFERHVFRQTMQNVGESIDNYVMRLKSMVKSCEFDKYSNDEAIKDQLIDKCTSKRLRRSLLKEPNLTLEKAREIARIMEATEEQAAAIEENSTIAVNAIQCSNDKEETINMSQQRSRYKRSGVKCNGCGRFGHSSGSDNCPAAGQECFKCGKSNHFARFCRGVQRQSQTRGNRTAISNISRNQDPYDDDDVNVIFSVRNGLADAVVKIDDDEVTMMIDSGATVNIIDKKTFSKITKRNLSSIQTKVFTYGANEPLSLLGAFNAVVSFKNMRVPTRILVAESDSAGCLLSRQTATQLKLLHLASAVKSENPIADKLREKYSSVFSGVGKLKEFQLEIPVDKNVQPVVQPERRLPYALREKVNEKLNELLEADIIEPVRGPTPWVSPLVVVPKPNGEVRVCVDMRRVNKAVMRSRYPIPTVQDTLLKMNGAQVFSKIDLKWGYHQIELAESSRSVTTFRCHKGLFQYKRLLFGISCASELYQYAVQQALEGCKNVVNIADDIIVYGSNEQEHDVNLEAVMQRLQEKGLTVNSSKCLFKASEISFFGFKVSAQGVRAEESKIQAVKDFKEPSNVGEIRSFLGIVNFLSKFVPNLATEAEPIRRLTRQGTPWRWGYEQQRAFCNLKDRIADGRTLAHFDPGAKTILTVDASPVGVGALLAQETKQGIKPIAYASRTLTSVERKYSQTEREALAVVWGCEKFHLYLSGIDFEIHTDHKALEFIYSDKGKVPARIERWVLRLQCYRFIVRHIAGVSNPADILSRQPLPIKTGEGEEELYVNFVLANAVPKAITLQEIQDASLQDDVIVNVITWLQGNKVQQAGVPREYSMIKTELCAKNGILMRGHRIVVPAKLQQRILSIAHESHQGIVKTKQLLRTKVWWPGIDKAVEQMISKCLACQSVSDAPRREPLQPTLMPSRVWDVLHIDLFGPLRTGEYILGVVDECSRWPEVAVLRTTTSTVVTKQLMRMFATHGIPSTIVSDNGPQFASAIFGEFCNELGIKHRKTTPYWPEANAEIERFFRTLKKFLTTMGVEGKNWRDELYKFLLTYRTSAHMSTGEAPCKLLMNRDLRTKIPERQNHKPNTALKEALKRDAIAKSKAKARVDRFARVSGVKVGDKVLLLQKHTHKLSPRYDPRPFTVENKIGPTVILRRGDAILRRNVAHVKKYNDREEEDEICVENREDNQQENEPNQLPVNSRPIREHRVPRHLNDYVLY